MTTTHVTVTDAHHELALQVLWPMTTLTFAELNEYERWRVERVAQAIADAEVRGPGSPMTDLAELAEFLRARISELAEEAFWMHGEDCDTRQAAAIGGFPCDCPWPKIIEADCEAKRQIVEAYREARALRDALQADDARAVEDDEQATRRRSAAARCRGLEIAVQLLALPYANHPAYRKDDSFFWEEHGTVACFEASCRCRECLEAVRISKETELQRWRAERDAKRG